MEKIQKAHIGILENIKKNAHGCPDCAVRKRTEYKTLYHQKKTKQVKCMCKRERLSLSRLQFATHIHQKLFPGLTKTQPAPYSQPHFR